MYPKRDGPKRQPPQLDDIDWTSVDLHTGIDVPWLPLPEQLTIANLLPANVDAPDWGTPNDRQSIWRFPPDTAEFEQFLDEHFPREKFPKFRHAVDGPNLVQMAVRKRGWDLVNAPRSKLANYRFIIEIRGYWRAAARFDAMFAELGGGKKRRPPLLRVCEWCQSLFIAWRNNTKTCEKKCGAAVRQARKRARAKEYELQRELNISKKNNEQRKPKGASR
jgi:hypothetical protein